MSARPNTVLPHSLCLGLLASWPSNADTRPVEVPPFATIEFAKEQRSITGDDNAMVNLLLNVMEPCPELDRSLIRKHQHRLR